MTSDPDIPLTKPATETDGSLLGDGDGELADGQTHNSQSSDESRTITGTSATSTHSEDGSDRTPVKQPPSTLAANAISTAASLPVTASASERPGQQVAPPGSLIVLLSIGIMLIGSLFNTTWLVVTGALVALLVSIRMSWVVLQPMLSELISPQQRSLTVAIVGITAAAIGLLQSLGAGNWLGSWLNRLNWEAIGAVGDVFGAVGQILIAILAVYVAWRQYVISKDLTIQQNLITQQQTIDSYFQGISDLVLDAEGLLEDWPQERAIAEGRTAAILSSVDAPGKAKIVRFLSRSRLLTPLRRDRHLGRAMLDGMGGYQEDRDYGIRVIDLGVMLAAANLAGTDLRWTDISDANLVRANLTRCDLVKANLSRTILYEADLREADMMGARLFYGDVETATPRSRTQPADYKTGECTGAVVENANFSRVKRLSDRQRQYICAWSGSSSRMTVPGGCDDIQNQLGR